MDLMETTMVIDPCPETTCIYPWITPTGTPRSARAPAAAFPLGAGSLMPPPVNHSHMCTMMLTQSLMKRLPASPWAPHSLPQVVHPLKQVVEFWRSSHTGSTTTLPLCTTHTLSTCHPDSPPATRHAPVSLMKTGSAPDHNPDPPHVQLPPVGRGATPVLTSATPALCLLTTHLHLHQDPHPGAA